LDSAGAAGEPLSVKWIIAPPYSTRAAPAARACRKIVFRDRWR